MAHDTSPTPSQFPGVSRAQYIFSPEVISASLYGKKSFGSSTQVQRTQTTAIGASVPSTPASEPRVPASELRVPASESCSPAKRLTAVDSQRVRQTYAIKSFPSEAALCWSGIPGAGYGVCTKTPIPVGTWIGPFEGRLMTPDEVTCGTDTSYLWEIYESGRLTGYIDGSDENTSSWMRFIRCARHKEEQNLDLFQYKGKIFYRAFREIAEGEEMLVWYDEKYHQHMGIPTEFHEVTMTTGPVTNHSEQRTQPSNVTQGVKCDTSSPTKKRRLETDNHFVTQSQSMSRPLIPSSLQLGICRDISQEFTKTTSVEADYQETKCRRSPKKDVPLPGHTQHESVSRQISSTSTASHSSLGSPTSSRTSFDELLDETEVKHLSGDDEQGSPKMAARYRSIDDVSMWQCGQCHKTFTQRILLQVHVCPNKPVNPYKCGHCSESFTNPSHLRAHVSKHSGEKPFKCGFCSRSFSGATTLNNHIRTHTGEKPFGCDKCGRSFSQPTHLARHMRVPGECSSNTELATSEYGSNLSVSP